MNVPDRDFDRIATAWLDLMPDEAPDRLIESVLQAVDTAPQVRRPLVRGPWRSPRMNRFLLIAATIAVAVGLIGGATLLAGGRIAPAPTTDIPTPMPDPVSVSTALQGSWARLAPDNVDIGTGPADTLILQLGVGGRIWSVAASRWVVTGIETLEVTDTTLVVGQAPVDVTTAVSVDGMALRSCTQLEVGRYAWLRGASEPGNGIDSSAPLELTVIDDPCPSRAALLAGAWRPSGWAPPGGGPSIIRVAGIDVTLGLPVTQSSESDGNGSGWLMSSPDGRTSLGVWADPEIILDPCDELSATTDAATTPDAFLAAIERNPAFRVARTEIARLGLHRVEATHVVLEPGANIPRCVAQPGRVAEAFRVDRSWRIPTRTDLYLVSAPRGGHLLVFVIMMPSEDDREWIVRSIELNEALP